MHDELREWLRFVESDGHLLRQRPSLIFSLAAAQHEESVCCRTALARAEQRRVGHSWIAWLNKPRTHSSRLVTLVGHDDDVTLISFLPDGSRIITGSLDGTERLWDARSGALQQILARHTRHVTCHDCSPDGTRIVSGSFDQNLMLTDPSGTEVAVLSGHEHAITACTFSSDSRWLASTDVNSVFVWDAITGRRRVALTGYEGFIRALRFEPDSHALIGITNHCRMIWWDVETGKQVRLVEFFPGIEHWSVEHAAINSDGTSAAAITMSGQLAHWNRERGVTSRTRFGFSCRGCEVTAFSLSCDGNHVAVATRPKTVMTKSDLDDLTLTIYHAPDLSERLLQGHTQQVYALAFSNDASKLASGASDQTLRVWDVKSGSLVAVFSEWGEVASALSTTTITACTFSPDSHCVVAGSYRVAKMWALSAAQESITHRAPKASIESCLVAPNRQTFLTLRYSEPPIEVCDAETGEPLRSIGRSRHMQYQPIGYAYSPSGDAVLLAESKQPLEIWDIPTGQVRQQFNPESSGSKWARCCFSPLGTHVAALRQFHGETIDVWEVASGKLVKRIEITGDLISLTFSPDGDFLLWETKLGVLSYLYMQGLEQLVSVNERLCEGRGAGFSPDGQYIVSSFFYWMDNTVAVKCWDRNLTERKIFSAGSADSAFDIGIPSFSCDSRYLLCGVKGKLRVWNFSPERSCISPVTTGGEPMEVADVRSARFAPSGDLIAAVTGFGSVMILVAPSWNGIAEWCPEASRVTSVEWITNERIVAVMADTTVGLLELKAG